MDWNFCQTLSNHFTLEPLDKRFRYSRFRGFANLKNCFWRAKDIDVLSGFEDIVHLTLRSITLPDLSLLRPLTKLEGVSLKLGGTTEIDALADLPHLKYLEIWMVRGFSNMHVLPQLSALEFLFLQDLKNVTSLPSLAGLSHLRRVHIQNLKGLSDLKPVADAPKLKELLLISMNKLQLADLECFRGHKTLNAAMICLGSVRRDAEAKAMLGLSEVRNASPLISVMEWKSDFSG